MAPKTATGRKETFGWPLGMAAVSLHPTIPPPK